MPGIISIEHSQYKKWAAVFQKAAQGQELEKILRRFIREQAEWFVQRVAMRTPIDTGRLVRSWKIEQVQLKGDTVSVTITNTADDGNAEYSSFVEYGHATPYHSQHAYTRRGAEDMVYPMRVFGSGKNWVKGAFMATFTVKEVIERMPAQLQRKVKPYLQSVMGV